MTPRFLPLLAAALLCALSLGVGAAQFVIAPGGSVVLPGGSITLACANLDVQGTMALGPAQVGTAGNVSIGAGATLDAGSSTLTVGGNWSNAGAFSAGTGTVVFADGCTGQPAQITGATAFRNLTLTSATGRTFVLPVGSLVSVAGALSLLGAPGLPIQLTSATPGQAASIVMAAGGSVSRSNVTLASGAAIDSTAFPRLVNIATRMQVLTGADVLIGGLIIGGLLPKTVVVRARGPSLTAAGVPGALQNPLLQLFSGQAQIGVNDDWQQATNAAAVQASGFAPADPRESAILATLMPGAYTAIVSGVGNSTGVGIVEVFEVDLPEVPLVNIATRGQVLTQADVMIGGFIIQGNAPQAVVVRARGPSLTAAGVPGALQDPVLQLFSGSSQIAANDDWQQSADAAAIQSSGFAPSDAREAAILVTLQPGAYTAIVTGKGGTTGVGIIEVFAR